MLSQSRPKLLIPTQFALNQLESIDAIASWQRLKDLHQQLILRTLQQPDCDGIQVTDQIFLNLEDLLEIFAGPYADLITSKGVALLKQLYEECFLEFMRPPTTFARSLASYIDAEVNCHNSHNRLMYEYQQIDLVDLREKDFSYGRLFYLFDALVGTQQGEVTLKLCGKPVTRKIRRAANDLETLFIWENDSCRTQILRAG